MSITGSIELRRNEEFRDGSPGGGSADGPSSTRLDAQDALQAARAALACGTGLIDEPRWVAAARAGWEHFPVTLRRAVREFRRDSGPHGALLLRGLPVDEATLPPTPVVEGSVQRSATMSAALLTAVACGLGDPVAYASEKSGALVQNVVPVPGQEEDQSNAGSVALTFHTENAFHPHRPDFVMLLCLRADHDGLAELRVACARTALPLLSAATREVLASPCFVTAPPPSFGCGQATDPSPLLSGSAEDPDLRVDMAATKPVGPDAAAALDELARSLDRTAHTIRLRAGDLAIVDNRVAVHGRSRFRPRYDGRDRWLQRTFVCADLHRSRGWRPEDGYVLAD